MNTLLIKLYNLFSKKTRNKIGKIKSLKIIRDIILKNKGWYKEVDVTIKRSYLNYLMKFIFYGSIKTSAQALKNGIETQTLINSIKLIKKYKSREDNCLVIDIGCNFGYLSLVWAKTICRKKGKIISFEPNYKVFNTFLKSISVNDLNNLITVENCAIGAENKKIELFLDNSTSNVNKINNKKSVEINMYTVDSYLKKNLITKCDLIKIDVDGIEYDILNGCKDTLTNFKPIFFIETNNDIRIIEFFILENYKILNLNLDEYLIGEKLPSNIFCIPN